MKTPYWDKVLKIAEKKARAGKDPFTDQQKLNSGYWVTCACGKQSKLIPRIYGDPNNPPEDMELETLGKQFEDDVINASSVTSVRRAKRTLNEIERRAAEVIKIERMKGKTK